VPDVARRLVAAALVAGGLLTLAPLPAASACDPNYDPQCVTICSTFDHWWFKVESILSDPPPKPIC
jgi:hypothetical protein